MPTETTVSTNSVGYKLNFKAPGTVEDYDRMAGKTGACLEDALDNTIYRGTLGEWQDAFAPKLAALTGISRGVDTAATEKSRARSKNPGNVKDIPEKFKAYNARVTSTWAVMTNEKGEIVEDPAKLKELADLAQSVADTITVDPAPSKRSAGIAKDLLAKAESILASGPDIIEAKVAKLSDAVPNFVLARDEAGVPELESLARLIGEFVSAI